MLDYRDRYSPLITRHARAHSFSDFVRLAGLCAELERRGLHQEAAWMHDGACETADRWFDRTIGIATVKAELVALITCAADAIEADDRYRAEQATAARASATATGLDIDTKIGF
jgi:hypothetical protein